MLLVRSPPASSSWKDWRPRSVSVEVRSSGIPGPSRSGGSRATARAESASDKQQLGTLPGIASMRFTTYSKYHPELADAVNLQGLLDQLSDFLLQSGFAGSSPSFWHDDMGEGERSLDALRQAILQALIDSGQLTPEM